MKSTLTTRVIQLTASARQLAAMVSAPALAMSVRASVIAVQAVVGIFWKALDLLDAWGIRDAAKVRLDKTRADLAQLTDSLAQQSIKSRIDSVALTDTLQVVMSYARKLSDSSYLTDLLQRQVGKGLQDGGLFSELVHRSTRFFRSFADTARFGDQRRADLNKQQNDDGYTLGSDYFAEDYIARGDLFSILSQHFAALTKAHSDSAGLVDQAVSTSGKASTDTVLWTDSATRGMTQALSDAFSATDDVDGAASINDDQEAQFIKSRTDQATITDVFSRQVAFSRVSADSASFSEFAVRQCGRALSEGIIFTEGANKALGRPLTEGFSARDACSTRPNKAATEQASIADMTQKSWGKAPAESLKAVDTYAFQVTSLRADQASISDTLLLQTGFRRSVSDNLQFSDLRIPAFGKTGTEQAAFTDTGSLRSQGYCDFSYFAEDYVGASRTF